MDEDGSHQRDAAALEALRQRLYRRGASGSDVQQYLDGRPEPVEPSTPGASVERPRRSRRRLALAVLAGAVLLVTAVLLRPTTDHRSASSPRASGPPELVDIGDGQLLDVGGGAVSAPSAVTTAVAGTPVLGRRLEGRGSAVVELPASGRIHGGRAVVAVASDGAARVRWRVLLEVGRPDWSTSVFVMARGDASRLAAPSPARTFLFPARPPTAVAISAPEGVRWALVYACTEGLEPALG